MKKLTLFLLGFIFLCLLFLSLRYFIISKKSIVTKSFGKSTIAVKVISTSPHLKVHLEHPKTFIELLDSIGFWSKNGEVIDVNKSILVKPITIYFYITGSEQEIDVLLWNGRKIGGWNQEVIQNEVRYYIYIPTNLLTSNTSEDIWSIAVERAILRTVAFNALGRLKMAPLDQSDLQKRGEIMNKYKDTKFLNVEKI